MSEQIARVLNPLPPLQARKRPWLAFMLGFLFSGIALGIYFRSWVDLIVPTVLWLALTATPGDAGFWAGAVVGGLWGLLRAINANEAECGRDVVIGPLSRCGTEQRRVGIRRCCVT